MPPESIEDGEMSVEGVVNLLNDEGTDDKVEKDEKDDEVDLLKEDKKSDKKDKKESSSSDGEDDEDEDEENEDDEEEDEKDDEDNDEEERELELITPHRKKEILKEFPGLDKKFPFIFQAYYGYQQYTDILPTVEDAKEAVDKSKAFDRFAQEVMTGRTENVIKEIRQNPKAFFRMVDDYIPALARVDKDAATHVVSGIYKNAISSMIKFAQENDNEELEKAAGTLHQFLFSTNKFVPHQKLSKEGDDKDDSLSEERKRFQEERFNTVQNDMIEKMDSAVMSTIKLNIDPKKQMTDYVRSRASKDAFELLERNLLADKVFRGQLDRLWKAATEDNLSRASLERIRKAFLGKAKSILPGVLKHTRNEALKGLGRKTSSDDKDRRGHLPVGRSSSTGERTRGEKKGEIPKGQSVRDFIMSD